MGRIKRYRTAWSRHHRSKGHGIHSPFAFNFVRFVLREKSPYYCYDELKQLRQAVIESLRGAKKHRRVISFKGVKMIFRITNFFNPLRCFQVGTCYGITAASVMSVSSSSKMWLYEPQLDAFPVVAQVLMPYLDRIDFYNELDIAIGDYLRSLDEGEQPFVLINSVPDSRDFEALCRFLTALLERDSVIVLRNLDHSDLMKSMWIGLKDSMTRGQSFTNEKTAVIVSRRKLNLEHFFLWF